MFVIKMNEDKTLSQTVASTNYEYENKAETIWFLLPKQYGDSNLSDCSIQLYVLNPNNLGKTYTLNLETGLYKDTFLQCYFTITTDITSVAGSYEIWLNIINTSTSMVIKTASTYLSVLNKKVISDYFSSSDLSTMDKIIVETTALKDTAVTASETATQKASDANTSASAASDSAVASRKAADDAQQLQQAIETAEPARVLAEQERVTAENERVSAEYNRVTAESDRQTAENNRVTVEQSMVTAETSRANAESARGTAEANRVNAETIRGDNEDTRQSNESTRQQNEAARVTAEQNRQGQIDANTASISDLSTALSNSSVTAENIQSALGYTPAKPDGVYEPIETITLTEDVASIIRTQEPDGTPYKFKAIGVVVSAEIGSVNCGINMLANYNATRLNASFLNGAISTSMKKYGYTQIYPDFGVWTAIGSTSVNGFGWAVTQMTGYSPMQAFAVKESENPYCTQVVMQVNVSNATIPAGTVISVYGVRA